MVKFTFKMPKHPPCHKCRFWNPHFKFPDYEGISEEYQEKYKTLICCTAEDQYQDFSCFDKRDEG